MQPIEELLRETIGLDVAAVGPNLIQRAVRHRARSLGIRRLEEYRQFLEQSLAEWHELIESVVVPETWFFRDPEPIAAFVQLVREEWLPAHAGSALRLLSVPCSSGEEPFSLAMALLDGGIPAARFHIDGADISARALARAARGVYGRNSFRGKNLGFRDHHFQPSTEGFVLEPAVRKCVRFYRGNLLSDDFPNPQARYDFIFCCNLLIYFDALMRRKALGKIERLLAPTGVLFVSPVEHPLVIENGFVPAGIPMAFAFRKAGHGSRRQRIPWLAKQTAGGVPVPLNEAQTQAHFSPSPRPSPPRQGRGGSLGSRSAKRTRQDMGGDRRRFSLSPVEGGSRAGVSPVFRASRPRTTREDGREACPITPSAAAGAGVRGTDDLETARRLADAGHLRKAAAICEAHLSRNRDSAQAYYLLGLVRDASGEPGAIDCYRKALYLEPNHYDSLLQMALLLQKNGDTARARTFKNRAQRLKTEP